MSSASQHAGVVSFEDARHMVERHASQVSPGDVEFTGLLSASGRVLAEPISADRDLPPFPRATRDGYAVRAADVAQVPVRLAVIGESKAGALPDPRLCNIQQGQAVAIMTGAPLPPGADAVVMVEYTLPAGHAVEIKRSVTAGENYVPRGAEARQGQLLVDRGTLLDHATIAIAASVGMSRLPVFRKPRIAVLSTGDEIVSIETSPGPAQIRNSNTYSLAAQVLASRRGAGAASRRARRARTAAVPDRGRPRLRSLVVDRRRLHGQVRPGGGGTGGVESRVLFYGRADSTGAAGRLRLVQTDTETFQTEASTLQRRRTGVSAPHQTYFFGLPGNPVSTMVTFELFVRPMVQALAGMKPRPLIFLKARLKSEIRTKTGLKRFLPALLSGEFENAEIELARWEGSGDVAALARANCYLVIPPDREQISAGEWVSLLMR